MEMTDTQNRRTGAGYSIPAAAAELGISYRTMTAAINRGDVHVVSFGGLRRVPAQEIERVKAELFDGTEAQEPKRPRGRPPKGDGPRGGKGSALTTRVSNEMRQALDIEAARSGRSIGQVVEHWLERGRLLSAMEDAIIKFGEAK
jgi:hypothetical protein